MTKPQILKQKQAGIIFVIMGLFLISLIFLFFYFNVIRIPGFPELLPADKTIFYAHFPVARSETLPQPLFQKLNSALKVTFENEVAPWAGRDGAFAVLKIGKSHEDVLPVFFIKIREKKSALDFMAQYIQKNPVYFTTVKDILVITLSQKHLDEFIKIYTSALQPLGTDRSFITLHQQIHEQIFVFLKPSEISPDTYSFVTQYLPRMPLITQAYSAVAIGVDRKENGWQGMSYALAARALPLPQAPEQAYKAALLPFLPPDFDLLLAGQNIPAQLEKIRSLVDGEFSTIFAALPEPAHTVVPYLTGEFALVAENKKILFINEITDKTFEEQLARVHEELVKNIAVFTPIARDVVLPDGTKAEELIPNTADITKYEENFEGIFIRGFEFGGSGRGIFEATAQNKWFASNDLIVLKKALMRTREPGINFRDSLRYKASLQPILKNPELLGISELPFGTFSFSKRTFSDHMETSFMIINQN